MGRVSVFLTAMALASFCTLSHANDGFGQLGTYTDRAPLLLDLVVQALRIASNSDLSAAQKDNQILAVFGVRRSDGLRPPQQSSGYFYSQGQLEGHPPDLVREVHWVKAGEITVGPGKACIREQDVLNRFHQEFDLPDHKEPYDPAVDGIYGASPKPDKWTQRFWIDGPSGYEIAAPIVWQRAGVSFLLLFEKPGCAWRIDFSYGLDGDKEVAMAQDAAPRGDDMPDVIPAGYPYSPAELWRRLLEVIKTPPDDLTYQRFADILGLQLDPDKSIWYGDREAGKYFLASKHDIRNIEAFPFKWLSLSQGNPDPAAKVRTRRTAFNFDLFDYTLPQATQYAQSERYCLRPRLADIEALGYFYDKRSSTEPRRGHDARHEAITLWLPYNEKIFVDDVNNAIPSRKVELKIQPGNGCLISIFYFQSSKY